MARAKRVCSTAGCPAFTDGGRCATCKAKADTARGTAKERGYKGAGHRTFRTAVLDRDPICTACGLAASTVADHYPTSRRDLLAAGLDPDDPSAGRGLCARCHNRHTATAQPGGWHAR